MLLMFHLPRSNECFITQKFNGNLFLKIIKIQKRRGWRELFMIIIIVGLISYGHELIMSSVFYEYQF